VRITFTGMILNARQEAGELLFLITSGRYGNPHFLTQRSIESIGSLRRDGSLSDEGFILEYERIRKNDAVIGSGWHTGGDHLDERIRHLTVESSDSDKMTLKASKAA